MISFPYNANITGYDSDGMPIFDRAIDALTQRQITKLFYTNGVHADNNGQSNFKVNAGTGMTVVVDPGSCCIEGAYGIEDERRTLAIQAADSMDRIDRVVIRLDDAERKIDLYVLKGTPASVPAAPALTRPVSGESGDIYELGIADVFISKNTTTIAQDRITDTRLNASLCGIIGTPNTVIDASNYYTQFQAALNRNEITFKTWFDTIKGILGQDEAGNLLNLINDLESRMITDHNTVIIVPTTATWTQLTADNAATLDPQYKAGPDPSLKYPWFTDISFSCSEDDEIFPEWDADTAELGCLGPCIKVTTNKLRIYCNADMTGIQLRAYQYTKRKRNAA